MNTNTIIKLKTSFDKIQQTMHDSDMEFWYARDLMTKLGYAEWRNFLKVIDKSKTACIVVNAPVENHFVDVNKMVKLGSGAERSIEDIIKKNAKKENYETGYLFRGLLRMY